jgi:N-acetyltransferase 10
VAYGYSNIFVTAPSPENLGTLFEMLFKAFDALGFKEHQVSSTTAIHKHTHARTYEYTHIHTHIHTHTHTHTHTHCRKHCHTQDYEALQSTNPDFHKAIVRVNIFKEHRQTIQFIQPQDHEKLAQAELLVIDEAAAIPLPMVILTPC